MTDETIIKSEPTVISKDERTWATITHLSAFAGFIFPLFTVLAPVIVWLIKRNELPFVDTQGKEAINFQLTMAIGYLISMLLMIVVIGFLLAFALTVIEVIFVIIAAVNANKGESYRYPFAIRFIK